MENQFKDFIESCISSGKCIENNFDLSQKEILEIEDILNRFNDTTAKIKIRKIIRNRQI